MNKKLILFIFLLLLTSSFATVYFVSPTPANNTNDFTYPIVLNVTTTETGLTTPCYLEVDGVNKTGTIAGLACSYTLPYSETYFNHTYSVIAYSNETKWCYQEFANVSTACGGFDNGTYYTINVSSTLAYFDINYTKPLNSTNNSLWQIKHACLDIYNITIPSQCWNAYSDKIMLRLTSTYTITDTSRAYCYNSTDWIEIGQTSGDCSGGTIGADSVINLYDGNWGTGATWNDGFGMWFGISLGYKYGIWEEAMWWQTTDDIDVSNETLTIPYYGCGHISASGIMLGNVLSNETCFTFDSGKALNGNGYNITGSQNGYGFDASTCGVPMLSYCNISNVNIKNFSYGLYGVSANIYNITTSSNVNDGVYFSLVNCLLFGGCNAYNLTTYNNGRDGIGGAGGGISILSFNNGRYGITGLSFSDVIIYNNSNYGIYINPAGFGSSASCNNVTIYNQTNYIYIENAVTVTNLTIGYNASIGTIHFPSVTSALFDSGYLSSTTSLLQPNFVSLNTAGVNAKFSVPANITINTSSCTNTIFKRIGFPATYADIILGSAYTPTYSSCAGNTWTFDVTGFSGYATGTNPITFNDSTALPTNGSSSSGISQNVNFTIVVNTTGTNPTCTFTINGINYVGTYSAGVCSYYGAITPGTYTWNVTTTITEGGTATSGTFVYYLVDPGGGGGGDDGAEEPEGGEETGETTYTSPPPSEGETITAVFLEVFSAAGTQPSYIDTRAETILTSPIYQWTDGLIQPLIGSCLIDKTNIFAYGFGVIYCEEVTLYSLFLGKYIWLGWIFFVAMIAMIITIIGLKRKDIFDWSLLSGVITNFIFGILILLINSIIITYALRGIGIETYI